MFTSTITFLQEVGASPYILPATVAAGAVLTIVVVVILAAMVREGVRAYRETQARQAAIHPDPEAERAAVEAVLMKGRRAGTEQQTRGGLISAASKAGGMV